MFCKEHRRVVFSVDGLLWISIDDDECHYLKVLCDEIFGRNNFLSTIAVKMSTASGVKTSHRKKTIIKEKEFNQVVSELTTLEQNYTVRKAQLEDSKEQIRGAYTALYRQLEKFSKVPDENNNVNTTSNTNSKSIDTTNTPKKETKSKVTTNTTKTKQEKTAAGLTPEEIAKINNTIPQANVVDNNGNEIPDYLKSEYNK